MRFLLFILLFFSLISYTQNKDYKSFDKALKYNKEGNLKKTIKFANKALENNPDWSQPKLLLASVYANNNNIKLAANYLLEVYSINDLNDVKGIKQIVKLYFSNGYYHDALYYCKKILSFDNINEKIRLAIELYARNCNFAITSLDNPVAFNPENFNPVNSSFAEFVNTVSVDGKKLFFTRRIEYDYKQAQEDLFFLNFADSTSYSLSFNTLYNEGAITLSPNGKMCVYTACDRENNLGGCDLYIRYYNQKVGSWSEEYNLGLNVNSKAWETQASFSADGRYLYFISNRKGGFGGDDIWRSEITNKGFLPAVNLGSDINTNYNEMSPFLHPDNQTLYFSSNGHIGMGGYDIYISRRKTSVDDWSYPKNIGYPINTYNSENSLVVARDGKTAFYTSDKSGYGQEDIFVFDLPKDIQAGVVSDLELKIITNNTGEEVILKNVSFASNSFVIDSTSFLELDNLISYLNKNPFINIEIQGHTDDIGSDLDNIILSEKRAQAVYDYLKVSVENKLSYNGYGESRPLAPNSSKKGREINRRTSFVIQKKR